MQHTVIRRLRFRDDKWGLLPRGLHVKDVLAVFQRVPEPLFLQPPLSLGFLHVNGFFRLLCCHAPFGLSVHFLRMHNQAVSERIIPLQEKKG